MSWCATAFFLTLDSLESNPELRIGMILWSIYTIDIGRYHTAEGFLFVLFQDTC